MSAAAAAHEAAFEEAIYEPPAWAPTPPGPRGHRCRVRRIARERLAAACARASGAHGVPVAAILSADATRATCIARAALIRDLAGQGFGPTAIGRAIGRDHSSVRHWLVRAP